MHRGIPHLQNQQTSARLRTPPFTHWKRVTTYPSASMDSGSLAYSYESWQLGVPVVTLITDHKTPQHLTWHDQQKHSSSIFKPIIWEFGRKSSSQTRWLRISRQQQPPQLWLHMNLNKCLGATADLRCESQGFLEGTWRPYRLLKIYKMQDEIPPHV